MNYLDYKYYHNQSKRHHFISNNKQDFEIGDIIELRETGYLDGKETGRVTKVQLIDFCNLSNPDNIVLRFKYLEDANKTHI